MEGVGIMQIANEYLEKSKDVLCKEIFKNDTLASKCHVSYGWPSKGGLSARQRALGQAWQSNGVEAIFINPTIFKTENKIIVLGVLIHELIHIQIGVDKGHRNGFKAAMNKVGLEGKATTTTVSKELEGRLNVLKFPELPNMLLDKRTQKKQGTRLVKLICECNRIIRLSQKAIEEGSINCGNCNTEFKPV